VESILTLFLGIVIGFLLRDIVVDQFKKRPYEWLIEHYLSDPELLAKADSSELAVIEMNGGCDKGTFRRLIMRPLLEKQ
jgi:hypothetical protein